MKIILLSGGSGKRLWPLSNDSRSKQFLKLLINEDGCYESMVQRVWGQLQKSGLADNAVIATSKSQVDMIHNQLGKDVPLVVEPERRDTFPAIALAASYLYSIKNVPLEEVVAVLPVDPYVEGHFFQTVHSLEQIIQQSEADLGLIGVRPTYPSAKYGYIIPEKKSENNYLKVNSFKEKPEEDQAEHLIEKGALWNCGVFSFKLGFIISLLEGKGLPLHYKQLLKHYDKLPQISFDYEVVENAQNIVTVPYEGYWKDLGTWNTLTEEMATNVIGNGKIESLSTNTHLINELDIPIAVLGLSDVVVAASPDGILVSDKNASPRVKDIVNFNQRTMYEETSWGWYRILDYTKYEDGHEMLTRRIGIRTGAHLSNHYHKLRTELWTVVRGEGLVLLNDELIQIGLGDTIKIPAKSNHSIKALSDLEIVEVQTGTLVEDDIAVVQENWEDIESSVSRAI